MTMPVSEAHIRERLAATFTRVGGQRDLVPLDFIPTHDSFEGNYQGGPALAILGHHRQQSGAGQDMEASESGPPWVDALLSCRSDPKTLC